jgi:hypothetical protein
VAVGFVRTSGASQARCNSACLFVGKGRSAEQAPSHVVSLEKDDFWPVIRRMRCDETLARAAGAGPAGPTDA